MQNGVVFVPVAVQMIFLVSLTALYWRSGRRKHFMILADSSAFYIVALLDLLSHVLPIARNHLETFKIFDIVIGALSFVPILLYTIFLFLYARSYFLPTLKRLPRSITKYALLTLIPLTIAMNELGSFLGIGYRVLQDSQGQSFLAIGFGRAGDETIWQFFTSVALVLLIVIQAFIFCFSIYVAVSLLQERRLSRSFFEGCDMPTIRGVVWIALGVKLGAIETVLGFVNDGFAIILTRRILRMASRCCLGIGALHSEGASLSRNLGHRRGRTMSQIRAKISNPRTSTFMRLSPTAEEFYSLPRAVDEGRGEPIPRPKRVTVHYDGRAPPALDVRLSVLDVPSAEVLTATFHKRGTIISDASYEKWRAGEPSRKSSRSMTRSFSAIAPPSAPMVDAPSLPRELRPVLGSRSYTTDAMDTLSRSVRPNPKFSSTEDLGQLAGTKSESLFSDGHRRFMSGSSLASDSLSVVHTLASQFPGIPPRRTASGRRHSYHEAQTHSTMLDGVEEATEKGTIHSSVSPSNSIKRKPPPTIAGELSRDTPDYPSRQVSQKSSNDSKLSQSSTLRRKNMPVPPPIDSSIAGPDASLAQRVSVSPSNPTPTSTRSAGTAGTGRRSEHVREYKFSSSRTPSTTARVQTPGMTNTSGPSPTDLDTDFAIGRDLDGAIDPFADSDDENPEEGPEYRISELATAESGLNLIATRVAQFDRQRRQSYRGAPQPSPVNYTPFTGRPREHERKAKDKAKETEWDMVEFPSVNETLGVPISRPRRLSAISSGSSSSLQSATPVSGKRVTVAARQGPVYSNPSVKSAPFAHSHTTSSGSAQTRVSHTERELMRIKSIGRVATRRTPTPTPSTGSFAARQSVHLDSVDFSAGDSTDGADSLSPSSPFQRRPLYDSTGSTSVRGVRSALRDGWTAGSDDEIDISDRFNTLRDSGVSPRR